MFLIILIQTPFRQLAAILKELLYIPYLLVRIYVSESHQICMNIFQI